MLFIVVKKKLHKPSYYLILNLSIGDLLLSLLSLFNILIFDYKNVNLIISADACYNVSILTTLCISIDRYIAIKFCLKYYVLVTNKRLVYFLTIIWIASVMVVTIPLLEVPKFGKKIYYRRLSYDVIRYSTVLLSCIVMIVQSLYMINIRTKHIKQIRKTNIRFGIESEENTILCKLKQSMKDVLKLNIVTVILVLPCNAVKIYSDYVVPTNRLVTLIKIGIFAIYTFSNPVIYALIMTDLRKEYAIKLASIRTTLCLKRFKNATKDNTTCLEESQVTSQM